MKKQILNSRIILLLCLLMSGFTLHAQNEIWPKIYAALRAYTNKEYLKSAQLYSEDFSTHSSRVYVTQRFDAARMWALAGQPDSAFYHLDRLAKGSSPDILQNIFTDEAFVNFRNDSRWTSLTGLLKAKGINPEKAAKRNYMLIAELAIIHYDDQHDRLQLDSIEQKYGASSPQVKAKWLITTRCDSINQQKVTAIIDKYDWPRSNEIDKEGSNAIFLVIQHAKLAMKIKYLPLVEDAVKRELVQGADLALLEDRINTFQHKKQLYGTQLIGDATGKYYVQPLEDPDNVDKRRAEVGLKPINEYLHRWKIEWNVEQYKKDLPMIQQLVSHITFD